MKLPYLSSMQTRSFQNFNNELGRHLQSLRKQRGFSQEAVGEALGMDRVSIGYIEQGKRAPRLQTLFALSILYQVEMRELFEFDYE